MKLNSPLKPISGLYAVTPDSHDATVLLAQVRDCIAGSARLVQYRNKQQLDADTAVALAQLCRQHGIPLIINDDVSLAKLADGVHLGKDDGDIATARKHLGADKIIGVSCYNSLQRALDAEMDGADYVAFGSMFNSSTKPEAPRATLELIREARSWLTIPIVAIGGITLDNAPSLLAAGVDAVAVINAVFSAPNIQQTSQQFANLFTHNDHEQKPSPV